LTKDDFVIFAGGHEETGCRRETNSGSELLPLNTGTTTEIFMRSALSLRQGVTGTLLTVKTELSLKGLDAKKGKSSFTVLVKSTLSGEFAPAL
jgi:hypothetical protein